jgi:hypothetical protein
VFVLCRVEGEEKTLRYILACEVYILPEQGEESVPVMELPRRTPLSGR